MGEYIKPMLLVILSSEAENTMGKDMFVCTLLSLVNVLILRKA